MDSNLKILYLERAKNEFVLSKALFRLSTERVLKLELELKEDTTFFNNVISAAYYCIFYSAKALLILHGIITKAPEEHKKTYDEFEKLCESGVIDVELLNIYKSIVVKADELLGIFKLEKGNFMYKT